MHNRYLRKPWKQILEALVVATMTSLVAFLLSYTVSDCQALDKNPTGHPIQVCIAQTITNVIVQCDFCIKHITTCSA